MSISQPEEVGFSYYIIMYIPCDKTFQGYNFFLPSELDLEADLLKKTTLAIAS